MAECFSTIRKHGWVLLNHQQGQFIGSLLTFPHLVALSAVPTWNCRGKEMLEESTALLAISRSVIWVQYCGQTEKILWGAQLLLPLACLQVVMIKEDWRGAQDRATLVFPFLSVAGKYTVDPFLNWGTHHRREKGRGETEVVSQSSQLESTPQPGSWWHIESINVAVSKQDF